MSVIASSVSLACIVLGYYLGRKNRDHLEVLTLYEKPGRKYSVKDPPPPPPIKSTLVEEDVFLWESFLAPLPFLIWIKAEDHQKIYKNKAYHDFEKYIFLKENSESLVFPESQEAALLEKIKKSRKEQRTKFSRSVLGQTFTFEVWALPYKNNTFLYIAFDVSEYEKEQVLLRKSIRHFESTLNALPTGIAIWGKNQRLQKFNSRFARFFQLDEKWLARHPLLDEVLEHLRHRRLLPEVIDFSGYKRRFQSFFTESGRPHEEIVHLPDERTFRFVSASYPENGMLWFLEDMTEPLLLKRKNNAMVSVLGAISHHIKEGLLLLGGDHRIISLNSVCGDLWGLDVTTSLEKNFLEIFDSCRSSFYYTHYFNNYKNTLVTHIFNRTPYKDYLYRKDGLLIQCEYIPLPNGEHLLKFIDVTEAQKLKGLLHESRRLLMVDQYLFLRRVQQFKSDFLAEVFFEESALLPSPKTDQPSSSQKLLDLFKSTQALLGEGLPIVRENFLLLEILDELMKIFGPLLKEKELRFLITGAENISLLSNKVLFTRFLSRMLGMGLYESTPGTTIILSIGESKERVVMTFSLKASSTRSYELSHGWYHPWDLSFSLLKEMAALAGGVLSSGTAHPKRMRLVCFFQNRSSQNEAFLKRKKIIDWYPSNRQSRDTACG
jgi:PAS domain-containing protein